MSIDLYIDILSLSTVYNAYFIYTVYMCIVMIPGRYYGELKIRSQKFVRKVVYWVQQYIITLEEEYIKNSNSCKTTCQH